MWIYKKPFILENIKKLPEKPKKIYDHWVLSKAFSFPDETIEEFINEYSVAISVSGDVGQGGKVALGSARVPLVPAKG